MKIMPKINRIRIANIHYDGKIIKDLLLNCYSGENVLLNLANGGGKSVLVQLLQQPLMPESKIHNREVHSYLSSEQPAYILIEWKLDNSPSNYLLTGIIINKLFSSDDMNKTKYFTFINQYKASNEFDIKNIPFIQKENNVTVYKSYETALKMLNEVRNMPQLNSYTRSEQVAYRQKLAEYGIFVNEWKLLSKMNENEGGVDELFKACRTSDKLVDDWILKTVSDSNDAESKELKEMFATLMQEIIEKEGNIKEKEILEDFKTKVVEYKEDLNSLLKYLEDLRQIEISINSFYVNLKELSNKNREKIEEIAQKISQGQKELEQINYEEVSEEYYHLKSNLDAVKEEKDKKAQELDKQRERVESAKFNYRLQKVAGIVQKQKEVEAKLNALLLDRSSLESQNDKDEHLIKVEYSLQEQYKEKVENLNNELSKIDENNKQIKEDIKKGKEKIAENQKAITDISTRLGILQEKIGQFEIYEKNVFEKMNIFITRNLLNELDEKEVENVKLDLENKIDKIKEEIEENENQVQNAIKQIEEINNKEEENNNKLVELNSKYTKKTLEYQEFQKKENELRSILDFHRIKENIFNKQVYLPIISEKRLEYKRKVEELVGKIDKAKEIIVDLEQGGIHNSKEIRKVLEDANISYITGEEYLKKQESNYQKELLEKNPLLPYCYIVTEEDLNIIKRLDIKEESNKLAPVITYQDIDKVVQKDQNMVQIDQMYFLSLYNKECFSSNAEEYKQKLESQLEAYKKRKEEHESELHKIEEHITKIESFNYEENDKKKLEEECVLIEREIQDIKEQNINNKELREKLKDENEKRKEQIQEQKNILVKQNNMKSEFFEYLDKNKDYCENKKEKADLENEVTSLKQKNGEIQIEIEAGEDLRKENLTRKNEINNIVQSINNKQLKIPKRENQERLNISLEELEAQYEQLSKKYEQSRIQIDEQMDFWNKRKLELDKEKSKDYEDIQETQYALISYSEELEELAKEKKEDEEKELEYKEKEYIKIDKEHTRVETQYEIVCDKLKKMEKSEPISASEIKGNYESRKNKIKEEKEEGRKKQDEYDKQNAKMQKQINEIERNVDVNMISGINKEVVQKEDLSELINNYKRLKQMNVSKRENVYKNHLEISNNYKEKHRMISAFLENVSIQNVENGNFDSYYYIYEKTTDCLEKLTEYIGILNLSLQNIEQDKKNILQHATKQGKMLYQEMKKISDSSRIKIGDRYVQILKIDIPLELKDYADDRIGNHIEQCIRELREECKNSDNVKRTIENKVATQLSDRKLLNLTLDVETIKVKLYKFDIENKNSGLRQWEDVIVGNSGGQKFIACFALISALIEYTRRKELEELGEDEKIETSKVFVLDNPFAKTSSKHLLEPMMEISKKFNIQMICLSDLSQSSITDKFTLIYQLALRSSKYTNNSFLGVEYLRVNGEPKTDASLEQVYVRSNIEQIKLWN